MRSTEPSAVNSSLRKEQIINDKEIEGVRSFPSIFHIFEEHLSALEFVYRTGTKSLTHDIVVTTAAIFLLVS